MAVAPAQECRVILTHSSPRGECTMPPGSPLLANIPIRAIENPQRVPVDVLVFGISAYGVEQQLGALSLFPINRPAIFAVRLSNAARIAFNLRAGISPLAVEVGPVRWLYEEPR
jgi:hypothetical protein